MDEDPLTHNIHRSSAQLIQFGEFRLDVAERCLWKLDQPLQVTDKALRVLEVLALHPGRLIGHDDLMNRIWGHTHITPSALAVRVRELRKALGDIAREPRYIATVHGRGYRFIGACEQRGSSMCTSRDLVARENLSMQLQSSWAACGQGESRFQIVRGVAGVGKTALVNAFVRALDRTPIIGIGRAGRRHKGFGQPLLDALRYALEQDTQGRVETVLAQHTGKDGLGSLYLSGSQICPWRLGRLFCELAAAHGMVLVIEDLHWTDKVTLDVLDYLSQTQSRPGLLCAVTLRPPARADIKTQLATWLALSNVDLLDLQPLDKPAAATLLSRSSTKPHSEVGTQLAYRRTHGLPLFLEHLTYERSADTTPRKTRDLLIQQIDNLTGEQRLLVQSLCRAEHPLFPNQLAELIGRDEQTVRGLCESLTASGHLLRPTSDHRLAPGHPFISEYLGRAGNESRRSHSKVSETRQAFVTI